MSWQGNCLDDIMETVDDEYVRFAHGQELIVERGSVAQWQDK